MPPEMSPESWQARLPGLEQLWLETRGDRSITLAVLDGAADLSHPCFAGADLRVVESVVPAESPTHHGTGVASILFGQHASGFAGLVPDCRGLIVPIFASDRNACSQIDLARAIQLALKHGAQIINVSGGQLDAGGEASPVLNDAIRQCAAQGVLIVAAAGNDGCDCLHVPAAAPTVLAVGAMDDTGTPVAASNWGAAYRRAGILAPGQDVPAARAGGGFALRTGTSWATPVVSAAAALLLGLQSRRGLPFDTAEVREALLGSARGCDAQPTVDCRRLLAGRLDLPGAVERISRTKYVAPIATMETPASVNESAGLRRSSGVAGIVASDGTASVGAGSFTERSQVYALGRVGYDFGSEARRDWFVQHGVGRPEDSETMFRYLADHPAHAAALTFTLRQNSAPIYALEPSGPFAAEAYEKLCELMSSGGVERVSVPGWLQGTARLRDGRTVPRIVPELRGLHGWSTPKRVAEFLGEPPAGAGEKARYERTAEEIAALLDRICYEIPNLGRAPHERAVHFAATSASQTAEVCRATVRDGLKLDTIEIERSPICRPQSDCWDVDLTFFQPSKRLEQARVVYRFTVDVSDIVPVAVGKVRHWFAF